MGHIPRTEVLRNGVFDRRALAAIVRAVAIVAQERRRDTFVHVQPHAHATARIARYIGHHVIGRRRSNQQALDAIEFGAHLHDIGKYFVDPCLLLKPGALSDEELGVMSLHPVYGALITSKLLGDSGPVRLAVLHHHEHWDGSGYPDGLVGTAIPLVARIVCLADVYTALRARRSYKPTLNKREALKAVTLMAGRELDPYLVEDFVSLVGGPH
jgi:putative two-component system response regulator